MVTGPEQLLGKLCLQAESPAVHDLAINLHRRLDARTAFSIGHPDGLGHGVGIFPAVLQRLEAEPMRSLGMAMTGRIATGNSAMLPKPCAAVLPS
jgi:hypothetical protein